MRKESDSSEDEGFYKPAIQITQPTPMITTEFASIEDHGEIANEIITEDRPMDFVPRYLDTGIKYFLHSHSLDSAGGPALGQFMEPIAYNKLLIKDNKQIKQKRFSSLEAKYKNNPEYELVYSKIPQNSEFSSYIFSLENTPDYNPNDFIIAHDKLDQDCIFDSRFQSGNLLYAYRRKNGQQDIPEYDLILQNDTNTKGYSQWFYFLVRNKQYSKIKINIVNFIKKSLMFLDGVRPVGLSVKNITRSSSTEWCYVGENVSYGKSYITRETTGNPPQFKNYYCFSFQLHFQNKDDTMYVALNYPYTYSRMNQHFVQLIQKCPSQVSIQRSILCHTISNNPIPYLIVQHKNIFSKRTILCMARQHPGQTVGSFVLESFLNQLITKTKLLQQFKIIVIPMVNPDGVIYGNFRTNLAGFDLNRQWTQPNRWLHPEIFFLSKLISSLENLQFCMDFHGHSKKVNSFIYACLGEKINQFRLYPYIYSLNCDLFSLKDCTYNITPDKFKTARVNVFNEVKKPFIYTLETSFFGHTKENKYQRFTIKDFSLIGKGAVDALQVLLLDKKAILKYEAQVKDKNYLFEQWAFQNKQDDGSQSNPSQDELNPIERKAKVMSDAKAKKPVKKALRKNAKSKRKQKSPKKKKEILQYLLKQKADSAVLLENRKSDKKVPANIKSNDGVIVIEDNTKKLKSETKKQITQKYMQPKIKPIPPSLPKQQQIKTMGPHLVKPIQQKPRLNVTINSNLFDTGSYLKMRQQISFELKKIQQPKLEISSLNKEDFIDSVETSRLNQDRIKNMKKDIAELAPVYSQPKKKSRQKVYVIKESKVVSSITRVNQEQMRKNIQRQISNRTMALKNCQKIMNTFALDRPNRSVDHREFISQEDPYRTRKLLQPLDIKRHRNFNSFRDQQRSGVFFSFLGN